jgi:hypothetical protein
MTRWGILTAGLYACALVLLTVPFIQLALPAATVPAAIYGTWGYWVWVAFMALCALVLVAAPVRLAGGRGRGRRPIALTIGVAGLLFALLVVGATASVGELLTHGASWLGDDARTVIFRLAAIVLGSWALWATVLYWMTRRDAPIPAVQKVARALLAGSVLELLIAIPTHIVVRGRTECCAGVYTFLGLVTGVSIMLLSFGPGVIFLFNERAARIRQPAVRKE